ncbi:3'(2'),5'-bisphosphate nucleotidase CysQ [Magnetospirillum moscoviense]|uniref:3'(2'),5'-bisphosphate nucleotidase CysQ n=1 Tax=Magnetospirillum moscoviense TaxID=1437059 RepID=A0A178N0G2_9PROT|nr:3'(2'),5'-bisphosphate nucleotidase CysQ [Magnetospirillum moscoviense]OAN60932.1 3'(2'),5'-bisphosphate nucleotidase CysQ [Magnetospirillum moscoviense]
MTYSSLLPALEAVARQAGDAILAIYAQDFAVEMKGTNDPVTAADREAEAVILPVLRTLTPDIPIVAEEEAAAGRIPTVGRRFWLVDPLDGTKEFVKKNGEFTVNIGLVEDGRAVAGVVFAPVLNRLWSGADGAASVVDKDGIRQPARCRPLPASGAVVLDSRSHRAPDRLNAFLSTLAQPVMHNAGSSLKFCLVAEGSADFYPRFGPTSEWDTAAAHAVLAAAGGEVVNFDDQSPLVYGKPGFRNGDFLARAKG